MAKVLSGTAQSLSSNNVPDLGTSYTMALWFYPHTNTPEQRLFYFNDTTQTGSFYYTGFQIQSSALGNIGKVAFDDGTGGKSVLTANSFNVNQWNSMVYIQNSTSDRKLTLNGGTFASNTTDTKDPFGSGYLDTINLGMWEYISGKLLYFDGALAHAVVWDTNLTQQEALAYAKGVHPLLIRPQNIVFYLPLDTNNNDLMGYGTWTDEGSPTWSSTNPKLILPDSGLIVPKSHNTTTQVQVSASTDDARNIDGNASKQLTATTHHLGKYSTTNYWHGWRWNNVTIPQGATIISATLDLYSATITAGTTAKAIFYGVDEDDTATFDTSSNHPEGKTRTTATVAKDFTVSQWSTPGFGIDLVEVGTLVQEIVDRPGWVSGNDLGIVAQDNGSADNNYVGYSTYNRDSARGSILTITYTEATGGSTAEATLSPVTLTLSTPQLTATATEVSEATLSPVTTTLTLPQLVAEAVEIAEATLSPVTTTLTIPQLVAEAIQESEATLSPLTTTLTVPQLVAEAEEISEATLTPVTLTLTAPQITTTSGETAEATLSPVVLNLSTPQLTTSTIEEVTATLSPVQLTLNTPQITATATSLLGDTRDTVIFYDWLLGKLSIAPTNDLELVETDPTTNLYAGRQIINTTDNQIKVYYANSWQLVKQLTT